MSNFNHEIKAGDIVQCYIDELPDTISPFMAGRHCVYEEDNNLWVPTEHSEGHYKLLIDGNSKIMYYITEEGYYTPVGKVHPLTNLSQEEVAAITEKDRTARDTSVRPSGNFWIVNAGMYNKRYLDYMDNLGKEIARKLMEGYKHD